MAQLILVRVREDGDFETIAAIKDDGDCEIPAIEWMLQMREHMQDIDESGEFRILLGEEIVDVLSQDTNYEDVTELCESSFNRGG